MASRKLFVAPVAALGIVFGDIGTSPLYAFNQLVFKSGSVDPQNSESVLGAVSLVLWLLTLVICFKYVIVVLRADNDEQGGVFALLALLHNQKAKAVVLLSALLVFAAGLLLGDGVITPAISVLSAIEGLEVAEEGFSHYTVAITLGVLVVLFMFQRSGTDKVGKLFGPIMLVWFAFLAILGVKSIALAPEVFGAINPIHAVRYLDDLSLATLARALGTVILVVTGGEALFADLGHLGKRPIRQAWLVVVFPALILNYLGQGAYVLSGKEVLGGQSPNLFFSMVPGPSWFLYPSVLLATVATVIASQALISGAFSLVAQGIALKFLPPLQVVHTHDDFEGQTYIPFVNWGLFVGSAFLVVTFRSSDHLADAYGLAVSADMVITTLAVAAVAILRWRWTKVAALAVFVPMFIIDASLFLANVPKIPTGGYVPLIIGAVMVVIMSTWKWGRERVRQEFAKYATMTMGQVLEVKASQPSFLRPMVMLTRERPTTFEDRAPPILELFFQRYGSLPQHLVLLSIQQERVPYVPSDHRYQVVEFENDPAAGTSLLSVAASFGFRERPDVENVISDITGGQKLLDVGDGPWVIHAGKGRIVGAETNGVLQRIRFSLFNSLNRQAEPAYGYFGLDNDARLTVEFIPVVL